ncbi:hypothetical protein BC835DRAFT_1417102 [Cytidiella melzeri]|nr:hypothetical protein BC835DRAFT_1417102 [Cytidiella melzeri]
MTGVESLRGSSLFNAQPSDPLANTSNYMTDLPLVSSSSLYVNSDSQDSNISDYARSIMNLVHELYEDFPALESPSGLFSASFRGYEGGQDAETDISKEVDNCKDVSYIQTTDLLFALEEVAKQVCKLAAPRPPSLSPMERCHALDSPESDCEPPPWDDMFDLDESTMAIKDRERIRTQTCAYSEESGYASGSSSPYLFSDANPDLTLRYPTRRQLQVVTDSRLTRGVPSASHSPRSPCHIPLPETPIDPDFMPASQYDAPSGSQSSRSKFRAGGIKDILLRQKRSAPPSPVVPTFALSDEEKACATTTMKHATKPDIRRLKSLLFGEAVAETGREAMSFLDI